MQRRWLEGGLHRQGLGDILILHVRMFGKCCFTGYSGDCKPGLSLQALGSNGPGWYNFRCAGACVPTWEFSPELLCGAFLCPV